MLGSYRGYARQGLREEGTAECREVVEEGRNAVLCDLSLDHAERGISTANNTDEQRPNTRYGIASSLKAHKRGLQGTATEENVTSEGEAG
jgi:hypothetical protein